MQVKYLLAWVSLILVVSGCTNMQVLGEIQRGRQALLRGEPAVALPHFQRAADIDPSYLINFAPPPLTEGVWTYTGRAYYGMKRYPEARKALDQALARAEQDYFARLYLGLVLGQNGDRQRGLREIETGLKGLYDSLEYIAYYDSIGRFFDSTGELRSVIRKQLASVSGKEFSWSDLISTGEWLGQQIEEEIDLSKRLRWFEQTRDGDKRGNN
jgi:tetratricopeptide (TPR) repeat protein